MSKKLPTKAEILNNEIIYLQNKKKKIDLKLNVLMEKQRNLDQKTKYIYLQSPEGEEDCSENDGIPGCIFKIDPKEWATIGRKLRKNVPKFTHVETDHSCGGHGCILTYNLIDMYENTTEVFLTSIISDKDFDLISNSQFIDFLKEQLDMD